MRRDMTEQRNGTTADRLTRLEALVEAVTANVAELTKSAQEDRTVQKQLVAQLAGVGKWDAKTMLVMVGLVLVPMAGLWGLSIEPIRQVQTAQAQTTTALYASVRTNADAVIGLSNQFIEAETQFRQVTERHNILHESLEGRVAEVWEQVFKRPMSRTTQYPRVGQHELAPQPPKR